MQEPSVVHNTFIIERSYPAPPERVFAAFADPGKKRAWYGESANHEIELFETEFRTGGMERTRYRFGAATPFPGATLSNDAGYLDIVPNRRIVMSSVMAMNERRFSASLVTFELVGTDTGTDLIFTHQGAFFEGSDGPAMREGGWRKLLGQLADEVARS